MAQEDNLLGFGFFSSGQKEITPPEPYDGLYSVEVPDPTNATTDNS
jgi:hypothetical protein